MSRTDEQRTIFVYRDSDSASLVLAQAYQSLHPDCTLLPITCTDEEVLSDSSTYDSTIVTPIVSAINTMGDAKYVVLGFNVPGGFLYSGNIYSGTSRISLYSQSFSPDIGNPFFSTSDNDIYDEQEEHSSVAVICSRIDAPSLDLALEQINRARSVLRGGYVGGKFIFDNIISDDALVSDYQNELNDFEVITLPLLGLSVEKTSFWDEQTDVPPFRGRDESIMWTWRHSRSGYSFFVPTNKARIFSYNADTDGAAAVRDSLIKSWPVVSQAAGYTNYAASHSYGGQDSFLRPNPFFTSLLNNKTIGEAFLSAVPHLNGRISLFGDPLVKFKFPQSRNPNSITSIPQIFRETDFQLSKSLGYKISAEKNIYNIINELINESDVDVTTDLVPAATESLSLCTQSTKGIFGPLYMGLVDLIGYNYGFSNFLNLNELKTTKLWNVVTRTNIISDSNALPDNSWEVTFPFNHSSSYFTKYHFELEMYSQDTLEVLFHSTSSIADEGWFYESGDKIFQPIPSGGLGSNFNGRRIRFYDPSVNGIEHGRRLWGRYRLIEGGSPGTWSPVETVGYAS